MKAQTAHIERIKIACSLSENNSISGNSFLTIEAKNNKLNLYTANSYADINVEVGANIYEEGVAHVVSKEMLETISMLKGEITLTKKDDKLIVECGKFKRYIYLVENTNPLFPTTDELELLAELNGEDLSSVIKRCSPYADINRIGREMFCGIQINNEDNKTTFLAMNGKQIALMSTPSVSNKPFKYNIPIQTMNFLSKNIQDHTVYIMSLGNNEQIFFVFDHIILVSRVISEKIPEVASIIDTELDDYLLLDTQKTLSAIDRVSIVSDKASKAIQFKIKDNNLTIESVNVERGSTSENVGEVKSNKDFKADLNSHMIKTLLQTLKEEYAELRFTLSNGIIKTQILCTDKHNNKFLIMPLRSA